MFIHENILGDIELNTTNENGKRCYITPDGQKYPSITTVLSEYKKETETEETKGLINKERLDKLKKTCGIVNIGRQSVLDYDYLKTKLEKNEIAGAILDVFSTEPIPKNSKLWDTPNLVITPHVSSDSEGNYIEMVLKIFFKNLKLFLEKKELINQIDRKLGY